MIDWCRPETYRCIVCRPALPKDTPDVLDLTRTIWEGRDYVPHAWVDWLQETNGLLAVAEYGGRVVGLGKLSQLTESEWWLEGLRVDPRHAGQGVASHLHDYLLAAWEGLGSGAIRLATSSKRAAVHHLCERSRFRYLGECIPYTAPAVAGESSHFQPLDPSELEQALNFAQATPLGNLMEGLVERDWQWARFALWFLVEVQQTGGLWWWEQPDTPGKLLLAARLNTEHKTLQVEAIAGEWPVLQAGLGDLRSLASSLGLAEVHWLAPGHPRLLAALEATGFTQEWDHTIYLFEKQHS